MCIRDRHRPAGHARAAHRCVRPSATPVDRLLHPPRTGEVQSRITNDIGGMQSVVTSTATSVASNLTTAVATAVAMAALSWRLSLISLVVMPPAIYLTRRVARMRREITARRQRELADLNVVIEEGLSISGIQLSKTMGAGPSLVQRFSASSARLIDLELRSELAGRWRMATMSVIFACLLYTSDAADEEDS